MTGRPSLAVRLGVDTGEVVTGREDTLTGDVLNAAAGLARAAEHDEILLGDDDRSARPRRRRARAGRIADDR